MVKYLQNLKTKSIKFWELSQCRKVLKGKYVPQSMKSSKLFFTCHYFPRNRRYRYLSALCWTSGLPMWVFTFALVMWKEKLFHTGFICLWVMQLFPLNSYVMICLSACRFFPYNHCTNQFSAVAFL